MVVWNKMFILLKRDFHELRRNIIFYFALFSLFPIIAYLLLIIPLSGLIVTDVRYLNWSLPGIWIVCSAMVSFYTSSIRIFKLNYETIQIDSILASPIENYTFLISICLRGIILGFFQFIFSFLITTFLSGEHLGIFNLLIIIFHVLIIVLFFSILGFLSGLIISNMLLLMQFSLLLFMLISFGMNLFIPIDLFPKDYYIVINKFPLFMLFTNIKNIIIHDKINWLSYFLSVFSLIILFFITLMITNRLIKKI